MNKTPQQAAQMVALLKTGFLPPYTIVFLASEDGDPNTIMERMIPMPPDVLGQTFRTFTELLKVFREFQPTGDWMLLVKGQPGAEVLAHGYKKPMSAINTPIIEKAIQWHTEQGHKGEI